MPLLNDKADKYLPIGSALNSWIILGIIILIGQLGLREKLPHFFIIVLTVIMAIFALFGFLLGILQLLGKRWYEGKRNRVLSSISIVLSLVMILVLVDNLLLTH